MDHPIASREARKQKKLTLSRETLRVLTTAPRPQYGYTATDASSAPMTSCTVCCQTGCKCD